MRTTKELPNFKRGRARNNGKYNWPLLIEQMQERQGEWCEIDSSATRGMPSVIKQDRIVALREARENGWDFEVATRNNDFTTHRAELWMKATRRKKGRK